MLNENIVTGGYHFLSIWNYVSSVMVSCELIILIMMLLMMMKEKEGSGEEEKIT